MKYRWFLLPAAAALGIAALAAPDRDVRGAEHPERIVSKRIRILSSERYGELRDAWEAYTKGHPKDPMGWTELAKASRYAGVPCEEYIRFAEKAAYLDSGYADGLTALGSYRWCVYCPTEPVDPSAGIALLERALLIDPGYGEPHYTLWVMKMSEGKKEEANLHLTALLDGGHIPEPLVDLAQNMLAGVDRNGIVLTNGDNDTYPPLALQAARGFRTDVAIVNLSLLNLDWYREGLRNGPWKVPVPEPPASVKGPTSPPALEGLIENLARERWRRPLYYSVTVALDYYPHPNELSLEGIVYRVLPETGETTRVDGEALARNLEEVYRMESATSLGIDWDAYSALRSLMVNYAAGYGRLAEAKAAGGDRTGARRSMEQGLSLCEFHGLNEWGERLAGAWAEWDEDSPEPERWLERFKK
ncbi:MAG: hypothetical protein ABIK65_02790 [Candidatus Eisenbacteria bacterium]